MECTLWPQNILYKFKSQEAFPLFWVHCHCCYYCYLYLSLFVSFSKYIWYTTHVLAHWHGKAYDENHFRLSFVEVFFFSLLLLFSQTFSSYFIVPFDNFTPPSSSSMRRKVTKIHFWNLKRWICRMSLHHIALHFYAGWNRSDIHFFYYYFLHLWS